MLHLSTSTSTNATTSYQYHGGKSASPTLTERFPVPTPPPSSASPVELAPIVDICDLVGKNYFYNRPPSPDSPKLKKLSDVHHPHYHLENSFDQPPAYLEPTPQLLVEPSSSLIFPLELFNTMKGHSKQYHIPSTATTTLQIPIPRRQSQLQPLQPQVNSRIIISPSPSPSSSCSTSMDPMSPTMAAASASAAAAADHRHPGSHVAKSLLKSISKNNKRLQREDDHDLSYHHNSSPPAATAATNSTEVNSHHHGNKKQHLAQANNNNVDQSMFLTKNAHIKRPRNAWIHFRCHYGQALKAQDPTLRAEEISKRASRRWGKLTENEKRPWHGLAEQEKLAHREAFPEYRYCPRRATSSSSPSSPPIANNTVVVNNRARSATTSEINNTPLRMHDVFSIPSSTSSIRPQKRMKRNSK